MTYQPIKVGGAQEKNTQSFMAKKGVNLRDLSQLLNPESAKIIKNYLVTAEGGLEKRGGLDPLFDAISDTAMTMLEKWTDDIYMFGYDDNKLAAYYKSTDTIVDIKTDFLDNVTGGAKNGGYFLVTSPQEKMGRVTMTLDYDNQTANFTEGTILTGSVSGATATIQEIIESYTPAYLTGGTNAAANPANWIAVTDGSFRITIDGVAYNVDGIDFSAIPVLFGMYGVAGKIEADIRALTGKEETVTWDTDHFIITSVDGAASAITVTETSTGTVGTDISGAGAADWMDCDTGNGVVTNRTQDIGTLTLGSISGTFQDDETITDSDTGSADANGTVDFTYTVIADAPKARGVKVIDKRAFAFDLEGDRESIAYSAVDDGSNPPFEDWTVGENVSDAGKATYRNAGVVKDINNLGNNIIGLAENGKWAFRIDQLESAGTIKKIETPWDRDWETYNIVT